MGGGDSRALIQSPCWIYAQYHQEQLQWRRYCSAFVPYYPHLCGRCYARWRQPVGAPAV